MPADICCCCWLSLAKKRRNKKNTVFLPQCLCQGSSATGMWFFGRFVIFLFSVPPLFFFSAMFVSGKFRDGYVVFRKVCNFFIFRFFTFLLFLFSAMFVSGKFRDGYAVFRKVCNFFISCCFYIFTFFSACMKKLLCRCAEDSQSAV